MAEPDRTNADAERVSDIVAELRADANHWGMVTGGLSGPHTAALERKAADIIEAQSKALAEAREALAMARERFDIIDCAGFTQNQQSTVEVLEYVKGLASDSSRRIRALTPTPENPNG